MLHLVTGVPGASKTAFVVTRLFDIERKNKINLEKNITIFDHNKTFFEKYKDDFNYIEVEQGSGHELKTVLKILSPDYFDMLGQRFDDLRPDDYFLRSVHYNEIIERIRDRGELEDFTFFQPVRTIYSNIKALKIDYCRGLVQDWRTCPDGSLIVIDEVQLVDPYNDNKNKAEPIVRDLTVHRHRGFDFYFITQSPSFLHPTIKDLISCHLHITRPYWRTPKVYQYGTTRAYPGTLINKLNCEAKFEFKPKPFIFKLYKSTTIDTSIKRLPGGMIGAGIFIMFALTVFIYGLSGGSGYLGHFFGSEKKHPEQAQQQQPVNHAPPPGSPAQPSATVTTGVTTGTPVATAIAGSTSVQYDPSKPFSADYSQPRQLVAMPQFSGCMQLKTTCKCYTQQGTSLDVSIADCNRVIGGDMPFNPFKQSQPVPASSFSQPVTVDAPAPVPAQPDVPA